MANFVFGQRRFSKDGNWQDHQISPICSSNKPFRTKKMEIGKQVFYTHIVEK
jgi:hypothetical protein